MVNKFGDMEKAVNMLFKEHFDRSGTSDVPAEIMKTLTMNMVKVIMEDHQKRSDP
jgi:hypothetical protein